MSEKKWFSLILLKQKGSVCYTMLVVCVDLNRVIIKVFNEKHQGK
jgi:hypothetical protein